jgi:hypothetical protein
MDDVLLLEALLAGESIDPRGNALDEVLETILESTKPEAKLQETPHQERKGRPKSDTDTDPSGTH